MYHTHRHSVENIPHPLLFLVGILAMIPIGMVIGSQPLVGFLFTGLCVVVLSAAFVTPTAAIVVLILYLPFDWLVVLFLDTFGITAGRGLRDVFIAWVFLSWLFDKNRLSARQLMETMGRTISLTLILLMSLNVLYLIPVLSSPIAALIAVRARLLPVLLLPVAVDLMRRHGWRLLAAVTRVTLVVVIGSALVLFTQMLRGDTLAPAFGLDYPLAVVYSSGDGVIRYPGPFLGPGLAYFLIFAALILTSAAGSNPRLAPSWMLGLGAMSWVFSLFANNQRTVIVFVPILYVFLLVYGRLGKRAITIPLALGVLATPALFLVGEAFMSRFSTFITDPYDVFINQRLIMPFEGKILPIINSSPFGTGLGSYSHGLRFLARTPGETTYLESFVAVTIGEIGLHGFALWTVLFTLLFTHCIRCAKAARDDSAAVFAAGMAATLFFLFQVSITYEPLNIFPFPQLFWFLVGLVLALPTSASDKRPSLSNQGVIKC